MKNSGLSCSVIDEDIINGENSEYSPLMETAEKSDDNFENNDNNILYKTINQIPQRFQLYIVILLTTILNFGTSFLPVVLRKYGMDNKMDISFLTLFRVIIPSFLNLIIANVLEGKFEIFSTFKENLVFISLGIITNGLSPFVSNYISMKINANLAIVFGQIFPITNSLGSYIFKIEPLPNIKSKGSIILAIGLFISILSSFVIVGLNFTPSAIKIISKNKLILAIFLSLCAWVLQSFYLNYQIVNYTKNPTSKFFNKPLTFIAVCSTQASLILGPCTALVCLNRWRIIYPNIYYCYTWMLLVLAVLVSSFVGNVVTSICNLLTSPLFVSGTSIVKIIFGLTMSYVILGETMIYLQYYFCGTMLIGVIILITGKKMIVTENELRKDF